MPRAYLAKSRVQQAINLAELFGTNIRYELGPVGSVLAITVPDDASAYRFIVGLDRELGSLDYALDVVHNAVREQLPGGVKITFPDFTLGD